jgi:hypothetical protein
MTDEKERGLPTAVYRQKENSPASIRNQLTVTEYGVENIDLGDELVRRKDAEQALIDTRQKTANAVEQHILGLIDQRIEEYDKDIPKMGEPQIKSVLENLRSEIREDFEKKNAEAEGGLESV